MVGFFRKLYPKIPPDQIFYLLYAGVHPIRDYGHPGNLIPNTHPGKTGVHPISIGPHPGQTGCTPGSIWTPAGAVMKGVIWFMSQL